MLFLALQYAKNSVGSCQQSHQCFNVCRMLNRVTYNNSIAADNEKLFMIIPTSSAISRATWSPTGSGKIMKKVPYLNKVYVLCAPQRTLRPNFFSPQSQRMMTQRSPREINTAKYKHFNSCNLRPLLQKNSVYSVVLSALCEAKLSKKQTHRFIKHRTGCKLNSLATQNIQRSTESTEHD